MNVHCERLFVKWSKNNDNNNKLMYESGEFN